MHLLLLGIAIGLFLGWLITSNWDTIVKLTSNIKEDKPKQE